jgi:hypothetical protein
MLESVRPYRQDAPSALDATARAQRVPWREFLESVGFCSTAAAATDCVQAVKPTIRSESRNLLYLLHFPQGHRDIGDASTIA